MDSLEQIKGVVVLVQHSHKSSNLGVNPLLITSHLPLVDFFGSEVDVVVPDNSAYFKGGSLLVSSNDETELDPCNWFKIVCRHPQVSEAISKLFNYVSKFGPETLGNRYLRWQEFYTEAPVDVAAIIDLCRTIVRVGAKRNSNMGRLEELSSEVESLVREATLATIEFNNGIYHDYLTLKHLINAVVTPEEQVAIVVIRDTVPGSSICAQTLIGSAIDKLPQDLISLVSLVPTVTIIPQSVFIDLSPESFFSASLSTGSVFLTDIPDFDNMDDLHSYWLGNRDFLVTDGLAGLLVGYFGNYGTYRPGPDKFGTELPSVLISPSIIACQAILADLGVMGKRKDNAPRIGRTGPLFSSFQLEPSRPDCHEIQPLNLLASYDDGFFCSALNNACSEAGRSDLSTGWKLRHIFGCIIKNTIEELIQISENGEIPIDLEDRDSQYRLFRRAEHSFKGFVKEGWLCPESSFYINFELSNDPGFLLVDARTEIVTKHTLPFGREFFFTLPSRGSLNDFKEELSSIFGDANFPGI